MDKLMQTVKKAQMAYVTEVVTTLSETYKFPLEAALALVLTEENNKSRGRPEKKVKRVVNKDLETELENLLTEESIVLKTKAAEQTELKVAPKKPKVVASKAAMVEDVITQGLLEVADLAEVVATEPAAAVEKKKRAPAKKVAVVEVSAAVAEVAVAAEASAVPEKKKKAPAKKEAAKAEAVAAEVVEKKKAPAKKVEEVKVVEASAEKKKKAPAKKAAAVVAQEELVLEEIKAEVVAPAPSLEKKKRGGKKTEEVTPSDKLIKEVTAELEVVKEKKEKKEKKTVVEEKEVEKVVTKPAAVVVEKQVAAAPVAVEEEEYVEEEYVEESFECDPLSYNGVDYLLGPDNVVYDENGSEVVGIWNGTAVVFSAEEYE
jgi:hypothetical protein